jgi:hypothetical protein
VAEQDGRMVAAAAFWDQMSLRQTIVQKVSTGTAAFLSLMRAVRLVWKIPEIPRIGNPLVPIFLRFPACAADHPDALKAIVHTECNALKAQGKYHFLWASFHQSDPLISCIDETWKLKMTADVYHLQIKESMNILDEEQAVAHPIYVDFSIV